MRSFILLPLLSTVVLAAPTFSRTETRREALAMGAKLWIQQVDGRVDVQGWDRPELELTAEFHDGSHGTKAELLLRKVAEGIEVEVKVPKVTRRLFPFHAHRSPRCELTLKVPRRLCLAVHSVDGGIRVTDLDGYARCEAVDGGISLENLSGEVLARTTDGDIEARRLRARISGGTVDGRITLESVEGGVDLSTTDGSIRAAQLDGWGEGIQLGTVDGSIFVKLGQARGDVDASTVDGSVQVSHPDLQIIETRRHHLRAKIPGRDQAIRLRTIDGSIVIEP